MSAETSGFEELPGSVKVGLGATGALAVAGVAYFFHSPGAIAILVVGIILVALLVVAWGKIGAMRQKSQAKVFSSDLSAQLRSTPQQVTGADGRAKLDDLRRKLQEGFDKLAATGKNPYVLPWYLMVGEPGSGKTKAVAAANIALPGFQDPLQGTGGTVNMNWWFTNNGIILDTAGRLMLPEVPTSNNPEWDEFLRTLNRKRPDCPINGLLLTIPADTLITDSADKIDRKAGEIAVQFNKVQGMLGIRFPVFVLITKCDKILGFREYFETVNSPDEQAQMLGWSNPDKLDEPFRPDLVEQHLQKVHEQLVRRRLRLIQDPVHSEDPAGRRLDQVDSLYELPDSLVAIGPRLRRYLEPIFVAGPLSSKPLFLRGIYFTSSLQTGEAVDKAISAIMGVDIVSAHGGPVVGEKPYFLRHVFQEKVFREKGLVTRTDNVAQLKRRRKLAVMAAGFASVAALFGVTWLGKAQLKEHVEQPANFWSNLDKARREQPKSLAFIDKDTGAYGGQNPVPFYNGKLVNIHADPAHQVAQKIQIPWIFAPVARWSGNEDEARKQAYRQLFESNVVGPAFDRAADVIVRESTWTKDEGPALRQLLLLEGRTPLNSAKFGGAVPLTPVADYVFRGDDRNSFDHDSKTWEEAFTWLYSPSGGGAAWPPKTDDANRGRAIMSGVQKFEAYLDQQKDAAEKGQKTIQNVADQLQKLDDAEQELLKVKAEPRETYEQVRPALEQWSAGYDTVTLIKRELDKSLEEVKALGWKPTAAAAGLADFFQNKISGIATSQQAQCDEFLACIPDQTALDDRTPLGFARKELLARKQSAAGLANNDQNVRVLTLLRKHEPIYLTLSGDSDNTPKYAVQYDMLTLGIGQLPQTANAVTNLDDADRKLEGAAKSALESIKAKALGLDKASREKAIETAANAMVDVGLRRRRELLVAAVLKDLQDNKDDWGSVIRNKANQAVPIAIPLTKKITGDFPDPSYDPDQVLAMLDLLTKLKAYGDFAARHAPDDRPIMDYPRLLDEYNSKYKAWNDWYREGFQNYWNVTIPQALLVREDLSWTDFRYALKNAMDVNAINQALAMLADKQALAKKLAQPPAVVPPKLLARITKCKSNWATLDPDPAQARVALLAVPVGTFKSDYLIDEVNSPSIFESYWISVYEAGFKALGKDCGSAATAAATQLKTNYRKFPLANTVDELQVNDIASAQQLVKQIFAPPSPPPAAGDPPTLAQGRPELPDTLQPSLDLLVGTVAVASLEPVDREWIRTAAPLLNALAAQDLRCTLTFQPMGANSARDLWLYVNARLGDRANAIFPQNIPLDAGAAAPNRGGDLPDRSGGKDLQMLMFANAVGGDAKAFNIGTGNWAYLRLISDAKSDRTVEAQATPMTYRVHYHIKIGANDYPMDFDVKFVSKSRQLDRLPGWFFKPQS